MEIFPLGDYSGVLLKILATHIISRMLVTRLGITKSLLPTVLQNKF